MVLQQLDGDVTLAKQLDVIVKLAGRDGAGPLFFGLRRTCRAQAQIKVGRGDRKPVGGSFKQKVGEDRDGCLALHYALGSGQLFEQVRLADYDFHCGSLRHAYVCHICTLESTTRFALSYIKKKTNNASTNRSRTKKTRTTGDNPFARLHQLTPEGAPATPTSMQTGC